MLLDLIFPTRCLSCDTIIPSHSILCENCEEQLSYTHFKFDSENILTQKAKLLFPVEKAFALFYFKDENLAQKLIHGLKYGNQQFIGKHLAQWIHDRIKLDEIDEIISVPLHEKKLKQRGYNQLTLFGNTLSKLYNIPVNHQFLKRNSHDKAQAQKDKTHREETKSVFSSQSSQDSKHILLIDDVFTTGNTLSSIAWEILSKNPNYRISILVIAID